MRVAIVGSRGWPDHEQVRIHVWHLPEGTTVISGGARGVDATACEAAQLRGLATLVYLPDYNAHGKRAPLVRNQEIVDACDRLVAFHADDSRGTAHVIGLARKAGKPVEVFTPEGAQR